MIMMVWMGPKDDNDMKFVLFYNKKWKGCCNFITTDDLSRIHTQLWGQEEHASSNYIYKSLSLALQFPPFYPSTTTTTKPPFQSLTQPHRRNHNQWLPRYNYKHTLASMARANSHLRHDLPFPSLLPPARFHLADVPCPRMWRRRRRLCPPPPCRKG